MTVPVIALADDVAAKLATENGFTFERRVAPYLEREQVVEGKWIVIAAGDTQSIKARQVDGTTLTVDVAYQVAAPEVTDAEPDPIENADWFAAAMQLVETVKNCFRGEGELRDAAFAGGFAFATMTNNPIYRLDMLINYEIFTAVVRLEFVGEIEAT